MDIKTNIEWEREKRQKEFETNYEREEELFKIACEPRKLLQWMKEIEDRINRLDNRTIGSQRIG